MIQCRGCAFYDEKLDQMHRSDVEIEGTDANDESKIVHSCIQFMRGIPLKISNDQTACKWNLPLTQV